MKVALCVIATQKYKDYLQPLISSANKYFLPSHNVTYHLFTDEPCNLISKRPFKFHEVTHEPWPAMTLNRYKIISAVDLDYYDYVYYIDADMIFVGEIGEEIFHDFVAVQHPGYFRGGGSWETRKESHAYVEPSLRKHYVAGGFQGGAMWWSYAEFLNVYIEADKKHGITAIWHDESHWNNAYARYPERFKLLSPAYCFVDDYMKAIAWGISYIKPLILALEKDHKTLQK